MEKATGLFGSIKKGMQGLTKREQVMIYGLVIIVVLAVLIFLILLPALNHISELDSEVSELKDREMEMRNTISQAENFDERYTAAEKKFKSYKKLLFQPMDPEGLDELVTSFIVDSGLTPKNLTMTTLLQGQIPPFAPPALQAQGTPEVGTDGAIAENSTDGGINSGDADASGIAAFLYSVNVTTEGNRTDLARLLDNANATSGIEITAYSYSEGSNDIIEGITTKGTVTATICVYVYMDKAAGSTLPSIENENT